MLRYALISYNTCHKSTFPLYLYKTNITVVFCSLLDQEHGLSVLLSQEKGRKY